MSPQPHAGQEISMFSKALGIHSLLDLLVLVRKLLGLADHLLDLFLGQAALVIGDGNLLRLSSASPRWGMVEKLY